MITRGSQTDKFVQVDIPSGPKLNNLKANTELKKNLIIAPVDLQRYSARKCETSVMEGSIDQNYVSEKDKENGNDDQISMLNVVEKKDFINLPHSEVKSVLRKMAITNKQCLRCYKCFSDNLTLIKHIRKNCSLKLSRGEVVDNVEGTSEQERTCSKCRSIFRTILDLNLHKEFDHNNLVCPQCLTFCYNNIDQHHTLHKSEKKMTCEYCDGTLTKTSVVIHKVAHAWNWWKHGKSPCMNCNELVSNDYRYNHHFECSQKKFVCETCGYVLKTLSSLKKHKLEHEKLYKCVICLKDFFNKKELIRHNQVSHIILSSIQLKKIKLKNDALSPPCQTVKGQKQRNSPKRINFTRTEV
ncbi:zinc finger protein 729 [Agrilus planipennis]|uniref:Zinc finger protein 729 n=1 Tax=Agrilus planipennis TaxID=224129 RepID=A0A1W4WYV7_AGRPL|nr:zinc finger protein 729 [Agrilus planipennis]